MGLGAAAGGIAAGAAAGTLAAGPVGTVVGAAIGAVVGGLGGKAAAEGINPTVEENYWREDFEREPYYQSGRSFDDYSPAYRLGIEANRVLVHGELGSLQATGIRFAQRTQSLGFKPTAIQAGHQLTTFVR